MAQFFKSYFTQSEFKRFYKTLLPELDTCSNCGMVQTCKTCRNFINTLKFFDLYTTKDQWDYLCNFLYDVSNISETSRHFFVDVRKIPHELHNIIFYISNKNDNNAIMFAQNKNKMCYLSGAKNTSILKMKKNPLSTSFLGNVKRKNSESK